MVKIYYHKSRGKFNKKGVAVSKTATLSKTTLCQDNYLAQGYLYTTTGQ